MIARAAADGSALAAYRAGLCCLQAEQPDMLAAKAWLARGAELGFMPAHRLLRSLLIAKAGPHRSAPHCHPLGEGQQLCHGGAPPLAANALAQDCSDKNWKACKGKPWVIGIAVNGAADKSETRYYSCFTQLEVESSGGFKKLGVEKLHPISARGILIDVAALKGVDSLEAGCEITLADINAALDKQGMKDFRFMPGDGVFLRTGWGRHWIKGNAKYNGGEPGIGMEVARWLSDVVQAGVVGADTWATEVNPNKEPGCAFCVHSHLLTLHGIVNQENMDLDALAADKAWRFMYVYSPVPIAGATGSIGAPLAIR